MKEDEKITNKLIDEAFNHAGEWDTVKTDPLFDLAAGLARENQPGTGEIDRVLLSVACRVIDQIHDALCPGHTGTWQQRAEEAVRVAQMIQKNLNQILDTLVNALKYEPPKPEIEDSIG